MTINGQQGQFTVAVWTEIFFSPLLTRPQGSQGCQKMCLNPLSLNLEIWCANMEPKPNFKKPASKLNKKIIKKPCSPW